MSGHLHSSSVLRIIENFLVSLILSARKSHWIQIFKWLSNKKLNFILLECLLVMIERRSKSSYSNRVCHLHKYKLIAYWKDSLLQHLRKEIASSDGFRFDLALTSFIVTWWKVMLNFWRRCLYSFSRKSTAPRSHRISVTSARHCLGLELTDSSSPKTRIDKMPPRKEFATKTASFKAGFCIADLESYLK